MGSEPRKIGSIEMITQNGEHIPLESATITSSNLICNDNEDIKISSNLFNLKSNVASAQNTANVCSTVFENWYGHYIQNSIDQNNKKEAIARIINGAKTTLTTYEGRIKALFKKGDNVAFEDIIPDIDDVRIINDKVVIVSFADGTEEKAVLCKEDTFSLEQGISICITKKILSELTYGNGSSIYNKLIQKGLDVYKSNRQTEKDYEQYLEEEKALAKRKAEKEKRKRIKKANREREKQIGIQKEAIIRALKELNIASADDSENVGV